MNQVSALLRIVCGLALLILAGSRWFQHRAQIAASEPMQIFGHATDATPGQLTLAFAAIAAIGLLLLILGLMSLLKGRR